MALLNVKKKQVFSVCIFLMYVCASGCEIQKREREINKERKKERERERAREREGERDKNCW